MIPTATPSMQSAPFAATSNDERVLALGHIPECFEILRANYGARQAYLAAHPRSCPSCNGTGQEEVWEYPDAPNWMTECSQCVRRGVCPSCGVSGFASDGCEPCPACGFEMGKGGMPERAFCTCGADRALYEETGTLPEFPE